MGVLERFMEKEDFLRVFGKVFIASGVKGIDGNGYWYDKFLNWIPGYDFTGATLITKTVTLEPRDGNLPLKSNLQPKSLIPKCIKVYPFSGSMMNAVGVSSPGLNKILEMNVWQQFKKPFLISIIPVKKTHSERIIEVQNIVHLLMTHINNWEFNTQIGIQLNVSCPNTGVNIDDYIKEILYYLIEINKLQYLYIDLKINVLFPPEQINKIVENRICDIITCSNTIPYGQFPDKINWKKYNGLKSMGGGGLSGKPIFPFVLDWVKEFRKINSKFPIKFCGGIFHKDDIDKIVDVGANAIEIGTVKLLRPYRIKGIIKRANDLF